jgi:hypothetical protein
MKPRACSGILLAKEDLKMFSHTGCFLVRYSLVVYLPIGSGLMRLIPRFS